jgi:hypothetical protein
MKIQDLIADVSGFMQLVMIAFRILSDFIVAAYWKKTIFEQIFDFSNVNKSKIDKRK